MQHVISPTVHTPNFGTWQSKFSWCFNSARMIANSDFVFCCLFTNFQIFNFHTYRSSDRRVFIPNIQWDDYIYVSIRDTIWLEFFGVLPMKLYRPKMSFFSTADAAICLSSPRRWWSYLQASLYLYLSWSLYPVIRLCKPKTHTNI